MIVHVIDNIDRNSGGPATVVRELAAAQARRGDRVAIVCERSDNMEADTGLAGRERSAPDVECIQVGKVGRIGQSTSLIRALDRLEPVLLHLHGVWDPIVMAAAAAAGSRPTTLSTHGMLHPAALQRSGRRKRAFLWAYRRRLGHIGAFAALNAEEARYVRELTCRVCEVVPNGINAEPLSALAARRKAAEQTRTNLPPNLLNICRIHEIKGLDRLIRAFSGYVCKGGTASLVIAGPDGGDQPRLESLIKSLCLEDMVRFVGPAWGEAKYELLEGCAAFVHTPRFEGFGIAVAEALGAGVPTLTTVNCHLDGASDAGALLQVADSDEAVEAGIGRVLADSTLRATLSDRSVHWASMNLSWASIASRTSDLYRKASSQTVGL
jgi:glycosyltransferase involved in cell wall biosynthesis